MRRKRKAFTIVELVIVIGVIGTLSAILIPTFINLTEKANISSDQTLLRNINTVLSAQEIEGNIETTKDVYEVLDENGIPKSAITAKQSGYSFGYDKELNRFIYKENSAFEAGPVSYSGSDYKATLFNAELSGSGNGYTGFRTYTGPTSYTYKYINKSTFEVLEGETIKENNTFTYWLHVPENYKSYIEYPLITYIHGSGGCLFLQENCDGVNVDIPSSDAFWDTNKSYWMSMQSPANSNRILRTSYRDGYSSIATGSAFGGNWDSHFISSWFEWVKTHPEDDCFIIFAEMNDEIWFDNLGTYHIDDENYEMMCIYNSYKAGGEYGQTLDGGAGAYNTTYNASFLGPNVWFQLLTQVQDDLMSEYNILNQYVCGASLGGISTYDLISHYPERYTAAFPCAAPCADISTANINRIKDAGVIVRAFHGGSDGSVRYKPSKAFCDALTEAGGNAVFTSVPGVSHASTPLATYFDDIMSLIRTTSH